VFRKGRSVDGQEIRRDTQPFSPSRTSSRERSSSLAAAPSPKRRWASSPREFDPQPFHVDEEAAASSVFGGLVPSGWHTVAIFMRLYVDVRLFRAAGMGSPGVEEIGWLKPVRPGDTLFARVTVLGATPSDRSSGRGTLHLRSDMRNQHDETVTTLRDGDFSAGTEVASPGKTFVKLNVLSILRQCDGG
jgi:acyl dehydratase